MTNKICINCLEPMVPKSTESFKSDSFRVRIYCGHSCSIKMRRRIRNRQPHPERVQKELAAREAAGRMDVPSPNSTSVVVTPNQSSGTP